MIAQRPHVEDALSEILSATDRLARAIRFLNQSEEFEHQIQLMRKSIIGIEEIYNSVTIIEHARREIP